MRLRAFSSIGGLRIYGNPANPREPHFDSRKDVFQLSVHKDDLSHLAVAMIQEVGADASPELIAKCRELVEFADEHLKPTGTPGNWTDEQAAFIKRCEDNAGESMRPGEDYDQYLQRLEDDYR